MYNKPDRNWMGRTFSAGVGATLAGSICLINGQSPLMTLMVVAIATCATLLIDEYGLL
jgi:hypothetical protein